jgi:hypothetical protein
VWCVSVSYLRHWYLGTLVPYLSIISPGFWKHLKRCMDLWTESSSEVTTATDTSVTAADLSGVKPVEVCPVNKPLPNVIILLSYSLLKAFTHAAWIKLL